MRTVSRVGLILAMLPVLAIVAPAKSPPVPSAFPASINLAGTWSLDTYLSDHSEQIAKAIQFDTGEYRPETSARGVEPGLGGRDEGRSRFGGGRQGGERRPPVSRLSADDRKLLAELTRPVEFPPTSLTIVQADNTLTITASGRGPETLRTDGQAEKHALEAGTVKRTAAWEGPQLRVAYEIGHAGTLTSTYSIVPTTRQLLIRVNFERLPGEPGPFEIRVVYNRVQ